MKNKIINIVQIIINKILGNRQIIVRKSIKTLIPIFLFFLYHSSKAQVHNLDLFQNTNLLTNSLAKFHSNKPLSFRLSEIIKPKKRMRSAQTLKVLAKYDLVHNEYADSTIIFEHGNNIITYNNDPIALFYSKFDSISFYNSNIGSPSSYSTRKFDAITDSLTEYSSYDVNNNQETRTQISYPNAYTVEHLSQKYNNTLGNWVNINKSVANLNTNGDTISIYKSYFHPFTSMELPLSMDSMLYNGSQKISWSIWTYDTTNGIYNIESEEVRNYSGTLLTDINYYSFDSNANIIGNGFIIFSYIGNSLASFTNVSSADSIIAKFNTDENIISYQIYKYDNINNAFNTFVSNYDTFSYSSTQKIIYSLGTRSNLALFDTIKTYYTYNGNDDMERIDQERLLAGTISYTPYSYSNLYYTMPSPPIIFPNATSNVVMDSQYKIYPNPASHSIIITGEVSSIICYNLYGQKINLSTISKKYNENVIDISRLPIGNYILLDAHKRIGMFTIDK
jgi:hypothetical protein